MPVSTAYQESNRSQTRRLRALAVSLDDQRFAVRLPNGWTVAVALAHIAFWDRQRLCLMRRWATGRQASGGYDGEVFNEAMLPLLEAIPAREAVRLALTAADEADALLEQVPDEVVAMALARPDAPNLDRGSHRGYHLDQIEKALRAAGHL